MSAPVDVLAVMQDRADYIGDEGYDFTASELIRARVAVAELIEAARDAAAILQEKAGPLEQETPRRLYAALANIGSAS